jgi:anti-anti-sigma factor
MRQFSSSTPADGHVVISFPTHALGGEQGVTLSAMIATALKGGATTVIFNLSPVEVMNSTGLGMLVSALASTGRGQARLVLAAVPEKVQDLLEITHLATVFESASTVQEALSA